jgi:Ca2+-dependent lipid-binding protein
MDPYVILTVGAQKFKTKTLDEAGKNPVWSNEVFVFDVKNTNEVLKMQVFDEETTIDDLVGDSKIMLSQLAVNGGLDDWFTIRYKGKKAGEVRLRVKWFPSGQKPQGNNNRSSNPK